MMQKQALNADVQGELFRSALIASITPKECKDVVDGFCKDKMFGIVYDIARFSKSQEVKEYAAKALIGNSETPQWCIAQLIIWLYENHEMKLVGEAALQVADDWAACLAVNRIAVSGALSLEGVGGIRETLEAIEKEAKSGAARKLAGELLGNWLSEEEKTMVRGIMERYAQA